MNLFTELARSAPANSRTVQLAAIDALTATGRVQPDRRKQLTEDLLAAIATAGTSEQRYGVDEMLVHVLRTLATFGPDASAAIPMLQNLKLNASMAIREAAPAALARIQKIESQ